jgi:carbon-monoxide dehydrogenase medium subunit
MPTWQAHIPALAALAAGIGDPAVRPWAPSAAALANNDPAADYPAAVLGLGATIVTTAREIAADAYFQGMFATALEEERSSPPCALPVPQKAGY